MIPQPPSPAEILAQIAHGQRGGRWTGAEIHALTAGAAALRREAAPPTLSVEQARAALLQDFRLRISLVRCDSSAPVDLCPDSIDRLIRAVSASAPPWQDRALTALKQIHLECLEDGHTDSGALGDWCPASGRQVTRCGICVALVAVTAALALPPPTGTEDTPDDPP